MRRSCGTSSPTPLKFTERGEVRVSATPGPGDTVVFSVADTGIGIAPEDQGRIFEEFGQVEGPSRSGSRGPAWACRCRGSWPSCSAAASRSGASRGSARRSSPSSRAIYREPATRRTPRPRSRRQLDPTARPVLVVEDDPVDLFLYEKYLKGRASRSSRPATWSRPRGVLRRVRPVAVLLDILLEAESGWDLAGRAEAGRRPRGTSRSWSLTVVDGRGQGAGPGRRRLLPQADRPGLAAGPAQRAGSGGPPSRRS